MSNLDLHHLAAAYALDALEPDERMAFEAHYHDCDICTGDVVNFRATLAALGELSAAAPPAELRARVLQQVAQTRQLSPRVIPWTPRRRPSWLAAAASVVLIVATTAFFVGRDSNTGDAFAEQLEQVLAEPDVRVVDLAATSGGTGHIRVAWSAGMSQAAVIGSDLPAPAAGSVYELWLIADSGPIPMRMLDGADEGELRRILSMPGSDGTPLRWGITIEPEAGSASPTGEILFLADA